MKILFVGNSYTYYNDMPTLFSRLCGCNGKRAQVFSVTKGSRKLHENLDPSDETTRQLEAVVRVNTMDVCILQEHSVLPLLDFDRFLNNVQGLMDKLGPASYYLYQTWGRKAGSPFLQEHQLTTRSMSLQLRDAYTKAASLTGAQCVPVGTCFLYSSEAFPQIELYDPDLTHPSYAGSCLSAMAHFRALFGSAPTDLSCLDLPDSTKVAFSQVLDAVFAQ